MKPDEILPYLQTGVPDFIEDERVSKASNLLASLHSVPDKIASDSRAKIINAIKEEIEMELVEDYPDYYVVRRLNKLIGK